MKCIHLRQRSKKYVKYFYCVFEGKEIKQGRCYTCKHAEYKQNKILRGNPEIRKLERNRFSVFTDNLDVCYECGRRKDSLHEIFGGAYRSKSMRYGYVLPACAFCHDKWHKYPEEGRKWRRMAQEHFERQGTNEGHEGQIRDKFITEWGRSYL